MIVQKFGGTSVGSASRMKEVAKLVCNGGKKIIVLSAMSGTTNTLVEYACLLFKGESGKAITLLNTLEQHYDVVISELFSNPSKLQEGKELVKSHFNYLRSFACSEFSLFEEKSILAEGELISTTLFQLYLQELNANSVLIQALDFMKIDQNEEPDTTFIAKQIKRVLASFPDKDIYITQGYISRNLYGEVDNLKRGGSDYTASLVGAAVQAEEIQIWTDIDGMHNNDPRIVKDTHPISYLSFDEAAELAYFGAKILHPTCILPAKLNNIPVRLLNTMNPDAFGTLISNKSTKGTIKAVAAKEGITAIKIKSGRMLLAYGFLRKVFEIFEAYHTSIDMITTSEVGVSVSIDNPAFLKEIVADLQHFGDVSVDEKMILICVVGDLSYGNTGLPALVVDAMKGIPVRMISYGGSNYNISFLIPEKEKQNALNALNNYLFNADIKC